MARATIGGQQAVTHQGCFDTGAVREVMDVLGAGNAQVLTGTADAISFPGTVVINNSASADACTLALPVPGPQPQGDDGKSIEIWSATNKAHTVTTPANGINMVKSLITFSSAIGNNIQLQAWNGQWMVMGTEKGVTLS